MYSVMICLSNHEDPPPYLHLHPWICQYLESIPYHFTLVILLQPDIINHQNLRNRSLGFRHSEKSPWADELAQSESKMVRARGHRSRCAFPLSRVVSAQLGKTVTVKVVGVRIDRGLRNWEVRMERLVPRDRNWPLGRMMSRRALCSRLTAYLVRHDMQRKLEGKNYGYLQTRESGAATP